MKRFCILLLTAVVCLFSAHLDGPVVYAQSSDNGVMNPSLFSDMKYRVIGPARGGRATAVAGIPSQPSTFYMGATGGGVWKTTDNGINWFNVSDGYFETPSIGAIRVALTNPDIVYVGTGSDGIRSNVITGRGVYKSTDAGKTWEMVGLRDMGQICSVEIHPDNPDIVFAAALGHPFGPNPERGLYRTTDGGDTWEQVLFVSNNTGACDVEFAPDNPNIVYVSMWQAERKPWTIISGGTEGGVWKSTDGGTTFSQLTNNLPNGIRGKSDLAVSPDDPKRLYVLFEAPEGEGGLYRSDDFGESFTLVTTYYPLLDRPFYYLNIDADPNDADKLYANSTGFFRSTDAGKNWQRIRTPHGDNHDIWINPNNSDILVQCNDGGANVSLDGCKTWSTQSNQLTAELYQVAVDDQFPYWVYAGQQDNSTIMVPSIPPYNHAGGPTGFWRAIGGCETGPAVPKPGNHNIVYANCKGRFGRFNKLTGQEKQYYVGASNMYGHNPKDLKYRFQRVSPIHVSPHDPNVVYHASQYLHKTTDEGVTWETISPDLTAFEPDKQVISGSPITRDITGEEFYSTIYAVGESPLRKGVIWTGANDGPVYVTKDGGENWHNVTPADLPKGGRVQTIEPSPHRPEKAYFATYRYLLDDWQPYIYKTEDYGKTWTRLTTGQNGIPHDSPTRVIREDPDREGLLYAGTEFGMYVSFDDGENWQKFQLNLPATPITDIKVYRKDLVLSTMGRSFWILDNLTPLHQIKEKTADKAMHIFAPRDAYRMYYRGFGSGPADPQYIPAGAVIDYYFAQKPSGEVKLEILDAYGKVIRTFAEGRNGIQTEAGMHRFIWNLRHEGAGGGRFSRGGPMVVPGTYLARLTVGDKAEAARFNVLIDPRVAADGVTQSDLVAQEEFALKVRDLMTHARTVVQLLRDGGKKAEELIEQGGRESRGARDASAKINALTDKFVTKGGRYPQPMIVDQISYLNSMINRADQKIGKDAYDRYEELNGYVMDAFRELKMIPFIEVEGH